MHLHVSSYIYLSDFFIHVRIFVMVSCMHFEHFISCSVRGLSWALSVFIRIRDGFLSCTNQPAFSMHVLPFFYLHKIMSFFVHALRTSIAYISGDYFFKGNEFFVHALLSSIACFSGDYFFKGKGRPFFHPVESTRPCSSPPLSLVFNRQRKT